MGGIDPVGVSFQVLWGSRIRVTGFKVYTVQGQAFRVQGVWGFGLNV